jgi:hypothetical protein
MNILSYAQRAAISAGLLLGTALTPVLANHADGPGAAGQTMLNIYDNTHSGGWNVTTNDPVTGGPDPVIGFVNFRPTVPGDADHVQVVVVLKNGAPNCDYELQLVTFGSNTSGGLAPDGFHNGDINVIGTLSTNAQGKGNSGAITVDVTTLGSVALSGGHTYAHIDLEDPDGDCTESDGTSVANNEYGASAVDVDARMHWLQP